MLGGYLVKSSESEHVIRFADVCFVIVMGVMCVMMQNESEKEEGNGGEARVKVTMSEDTDDLGMLLQPTYECCNTKVVIYVQGLWRRDLPRCDLR